MRTVINYLNGIYKDLDKNISSMDDLCILKTLNYSGGNLPDYSREEIQQLYLLRYAFAYIYEYSLMYDQAIRALHTCSVEISVTSLGCGAMIDYLGLREVLIINNKKRVIYTGVDLIDWNYKVSTYVEDHIEFYPGICADKYFDGLYVLDSDIYIFPKSISEISKEAIEKIALNFKKKPNLKDRFSLCVSLRSNESNKWIIASI